MTAKPRRALRQLDELATLLAGYIDADGRSLNQIALAASVDVAYLWRLCKGIKKKPSRDVLIRLGLCLHLEPDEVDLLLVACDYTPISWRNV